MTRLRPTRGVYDLAGVEGAAGPVQLCGATAAMACVTLAALTFDYPPYFVLATSIVVAAHLAGRTLRNGGASIGSRMGAGAVMAAVAIALCAAVPPLRDAVVPPDMRNDPDTAIGGWLLWLAIYGQCFAGAPGVLVFLLLPELASIAVFAQANVNVEMPACYVLFLVSASGLLAYANFLRRPYGVASPRRLVVPQLRDMAFSVCVLFLILSVGGAGLAVGLRWAVPSPFARRWMTGLFFQSAITETLPFDRFGNELELTASSSALRDTPVLTVRAPGATRALLLRRRIFSRYNGHGWYPDRSEQGGSYLGPDGTPPNPATGVPLRGDAIPQDIQLHMAMRDVVPVAGMVVQARPGQPVIIDRTGRLRLSAASDDQAVYSAVGVECPGDDAELSSGGADFPQWAVFEDYLQVTPGALQLAPLAAEITAAEPSVAGKVRAIQHYLEHECAYNLSARGADPSRDAVVDFVTRRKEGICADFASALAVLCRLTGIPSRVVTGYAAVTPLPDAPGTYMAREKDAHAWVEVYIPPTGWVTFDANPEREIEGTWATRLLQAIARHLRTVSLQVQKNLLPLVLIVPCAYIGFYYMRRRGATWRQPPRARAGAALRAVHRRLSRFTGWRPPGTTPQEMVRLAREAGLPVDLCNSLVACVAELSRLQFGREEATPDRLTAALRYWSELARALRRLQVDRGRGATPGLVRRPG